MPVAELVRALGEVSGVSTRTEEPLCHHLPLRVGGPVQLWAVIHDMDGLRNTVHAARTHRVNWRVHWPFTDWLVRDGGLAGAVFRLGRGFETITVSDDHVILGAAALWSAVPPELAGPFWDELRRWPGSVGGWLERGIDAELPLCCTEISVLQGGRVQAFPVSEDDGWPALAKTAIPLGITLMRRPPPRVEILPPPPPGALFGSVLDSTPGRELERAGVSGTRLRRWRLARIEPGSLVQLGGGSCKDLMMLVSGIRQRVEKTRGAKLEVRIPLLGNEPGRRRG